GVEAHIVLEPGAAMAVELEGPVVELELMAADAGGGPGRIWHEAFQFRDLGFERLPDRRHGGLDAEDELHMEWLRQDAFIGQAQRLVEHRQVEHLDLGLDRMAAHLLGEMENEVGRVHVDNGWEVARTGGE